MLGLAGYSFFECYETAKLDYEDAEKHFKGEDTPDKPHSKWWWVLQNASHGYRYCESTIYNYECFVKDGKPWIRPGYEEMARSIYEAGKKIIPDVKQKMLRLAELRHVAYHKLYTPLDFTALYSFIGGISYSLPTKEISIDPLEELRRRKEIAESFMVTVKEVRYLKEREGIPIERAGIGYEILIAECKWLLGLCFEEDKEECEKIVAEIESDLAKVKKILKEYERRSKKFAQRIRLGRMDLVGSPCFRFPENIKVIKKPGIRKNEIDDKGRKKEDEEISSEKNNTTNKPVSKEQE